jgi:PST family polysaccharide transporter
VFLSSTAVVFCGFYVLPPSLATTVGTLAIILSGGYSIRVLLNLVSLERIPRPAQRLLMLLGFVPPVAK